MNPIIKKGLINLPQLPLDMIPDAAAAYSSRRLSKRYNGALIRVRRSSDNAEMDIYDESYGNLAVDSLMAFVGAGSAYVIVLYGQSYNRNNVAQTTTSQQPRIVNNGVVDTLNAKPSIYFSNAASQVLVSISNTGITGNPNMSFAVVGAITSGANVAFFGFGSNETGKRINFGSGTTTGQVRVGYYNMYIEGNCSTLVAKSYIFSRNSAGDTNGILAGTNIKASGVNIIFDNTLGATTKCNLSNSSIYIGSSVLTSYMTGYISEIIIWNNKELPISVVDYIQSNQTKAFNL